LDTCCTFCCHCYPEIEGISPEISQAKALVTRWPLTPP
jgi:hypothetical protein